MGFLISEASEVCFEEAEGIKKQPSTAVQRTTWPLTKKGLQDLF